MRQLNPIEDRRGSGIRFLDQQLLGNAYLDFSSNDYLGLVQHPGLVAASIAGVQQLGTGSTGSRLLSGDLGLCHALEADIAQWMQTETALVFNSGYQMNSGLFASISDANTGLFLDRYCHASIVDGVRLSGSKFYRYAHQDLGHLKQLLAKYRSGFQRVIIITESVFSMDGDISRIDLIQELATEYEAELFVDEAHALGLFGSRAAGVLDDYEPVSYRVGTFGKAAGSFGAFLACSRAVRQNLINGCRAFIYSTALPPSVLAVNRAAIELLQSDENRREQVLSLATYFRAGLRQLGLNVLGESQIVPVLLGLPEKATRVAQVLQDAGIWVKAILPPTVHVTECRLRFSLTAQHSQADLDQVLAVLRDYDRRA